ncbi:hypothetical protein ACFSX9_08820 [Flavobacterium ardleyense]|uniref:tRNA (Guanine-N1)-methyltransferase n=1 Tax=Flavobacterium ardleyense TaxID=2038737 RepID=A0ABW5Z9Q3_9FLAO
MNRKFSTLVLLCSSFMLLQAEEVNQNFVSGEKLLDQFSVLRNNSLPYKNYKVVEENWIVSFQSNLGNYVAHEKTQKQATQKQLKAKENTIATLQSQVVALQNTNTVLSGDLNSVSFLGMDFNKKSFTTSVWLLVFGFLGLSTFLFFKFKRANSITSSSKLTLQELEDEYESFRRVSIEREQAIKRDFFNEMKKIKKLETAS